MDLTSTIPTNKGYNMLDGLRFKSLKLSLEYL